MNDEQSIADQPATPTLPRLSEQAVETILTLDELMSSARRVERTARICLRGDLADEHDRVIEELASLVDANGELLADGDRALADGERAQYLSKRATALRKEMQAAERSVRFRAMPEDDWDAFEKAHRDPKTGAAKDLRDYTTRIIAACAIAPELNVEQVRQMRTKLSSSQVQKLYNTAFQVNTQGGLDVPKSPDFLVAQKPRSSETS